MLNARKPPPPIAELPAPLQHIAIETAHRLMDDGYSEERAIELAVEQAEQESAERHPDDVDLPASSSPR